MIEREFKINRIHMYVEQDGGIQWSVADEHCHVAGQGDTPMAAFADVHRSVEMRIAIWRRDLEGKGMFSDPFNFIENNAEEEE